MTKNTKTRKTTKSFGELAQDATLVAEIKQHALSTAMVVDAIDEQYGAAEVRDCPWDDNYVEIVDRSENIVWLKKKDMQLIIDGLKRRL